MKIVIIDDEPLARGLVEEYLSAFQTLELAQSCGDGFEGLKAIQTHKPDLIFLDVQMPKINGFELLELLENPPAVIFTTAFEAYALQAFEAHAIDYLLKPFGRDRFEKAVKKWLDLQQPQPDTKALLETIAAGTGQQNRIVLKENNKIKIIPTKQVLYLESADDYVKIHTAEGAYLKNKTMAEFERLLEGQDFVRIHRSYLVQVSLITRLEPYEKESQLAILSTGQRLPVSKTGYTKLKLALGL
ncbi:MAG: DNA-binding response regulator [Bacteroidetes bacterium 24-39-8]|nr:MAG: DNA-binding response regulator [Sphingobacteriia bacterium 35-40-5]OYZ50899.1 MAG: DNA-binding response regulator [Bacteroidetes bacterium 24-39-8]HQR94082.1 LytTR family DNA-binding domain-containing protein [Sediminibacterium sp.]